MWRLSYSHTFLLDTYTTLWHYIDKAMKSILNNVRTTSSLQLKLYYVTNNAWITGLKKESVEDYQYIIKARHAILITVEVSANQDTHQVDKWTSNYKPASAKIPDDSPTSASLTVPFLSYERTLGINKGAYLYDMMCEQIIHLVLKARDWLLGHPYTTR